MVLVSTKDKIKIYTYFLQEGVFACKKDAMSNNEILGIPNLHCFLVMRSLISRKFATEIFSWQWHYYFLTLEGVDYLREYLGLPTTIIPNTHKKPDANKDEDEEAQDDRRPRRENRERRERDQGERKGRGRGRGRRQEKEAEAEEKNE